MDIKTKAEQARLASIKLASTSTEERNRALIAIAGALKEEAASIDAANKADLDAAESSGLATPLLKRLKFDDAKRIDCVDGIESLVSITDPLGVVHKRTELYPGLELTRVACPIGVVGIIFESRPDALVQISTLSLKSGNGCLLKGGSEARHTNRRLFEIISEAASSAGMPDGWIQLLETRDDVSAMLELDEYIDLLIPRGSNEFVRYIMDNTRISVMGHADGICHVYIDKELNIDMALNIVEDSKCQYPAVCNAVETLLVHKDIAKDFLPDMRKRLHMGRGVELRGCERTCAIIECLPAEESDWKEEYLDTILAIKIVDSIEEAITHINRYGSGHTDAIVTSNEKAAEVFLNTVDSADVFWNCSTRFADGFRFGLGAEVGISTSKLHARGPVGLDGMMSYKWQLRGSGQTVAPFADGHMKFTHVEKDL
jgi:glutamate-5-semialdehyde dehydrogenase